MVLQIWHLGKYIRKLDHSPWLWKFYQKKEEITKPSQFKWFYKWNLIEAKHKKIHLSS